MVYWGVDIVLALCFQHYPTLLPSGDEMIGLASALDLELGEIGKIKIRARSYWSCEHVKIYYMFFSF
jgi:hypothetical protein